MTALTGVGFAGLSRTTSVAAAGLVVGDADGAVDAGVGVLFGNWL